MKSRFIPRILMLAVLLWGILPGLLLPAKGLAHSADTGGIQIFKTDAGGAPLAGAVFRVAREAAQEEWEDPQYETEEITVDGKQVSVIYEAFYSDIGQKGRLLREVKTDSRGNAAMYGLPHGTHYLVEVQAPEGYNRITVPIRVSVNKYSHLTADDAIRDDAGVVIDNTIHIINLQSREGKRGTSWVFLLIMGGIGVVFSALALWLLRRQRK